MRYASSLPQGLAIVDMLATKRDMSGTGYAPVVDYDYDWAELEIRNTLNRPMEVQQKHALSDLKYCWPEFLDSGVWKRAYQAYLKKIRHPRPGLDRANSAVTKYDGGPPLIGTPRRTMPSTPDTAINPARNVECPDAKASGHSQILPDPSGSIHRPRVGR